MWDSQIVLNNHHIKEDKISKKRGDYFLVIAVIILSIIGVTFIYSASNYSALATYNDSWYFVKKQAIGLSLGVVALIGFSFFDYRKLKKLNIPISIITIILLSLVFVPYIGIENYGSKRWIGIGSITIQPSEIAKFSLVLFSATYISKHPDKINKFSGIIPVLLYGLIICCLIILEPNMSITVCVALILISMLFCGGAKIKHILFLVIPAIIAGIILIIIEPYRFDRLLAFINPWASPKGEGYQLLQSLYALGSGGWFGVGLFNSRQKYAFLPFAESDFILSIIGEEIGFVGLILFFSIYIFIIFRGIKIASKSNNLFGFLLAIGITLIIGIQTIINVLVVTGSIPPTGLPLPLISSGNTSIIIFMSEIGILFNISKGDKCTKLLKKP